jgi:hypothetical protein
LFLPRVNGHEMRSGNIGVWVCAGTHSPVVGKNPKNALRLLTFLRYFQANFASREVVSLLDRECSFESEPCCGEDGGELNDGGIGAKIGRGKASYGDCAYAVFAQNKNQGRSERKR